MKTNKQNKRTLAGFTLIEMVGVLAVIAILAALLVPKIFAAIDDSRYNSTVASINSVKAATMSYFSKVGTFTNSTTWDKVLLSEGLLERQFASKLGKTVTVSIDDVSGTTAGAGGCYDLDGAGTKSSGQVVQITINPVTEAEANELSKRIDGEGALSPATGDTKGRVTYDATAKTVSVYLAHQK